MRLAIIGLQHFHIVGIARAAAARPDFEIVGVAERDATLREQIAAEFKIPAYADYRDLLAAGRIDAAGLAPINSEKGALIVACLEAGVHVLVDKPAVTTLEDLARVEEALGRRRAHLYCALTLRFAPNYVAAQRLVARGEIGRVVSSYAQRPHKLGIVRRPAWMFQRATYGGPTLDLGIHDIDMLRWIHGCEPAATWARESNARFTEHADFADHFEVMLQMTDGSTGFVKGSWLTPDAAPWHGDTRLFVEGSLGYLEVRDHPEPALIANTTGEPRTVSDFERSEEIEPAAHQRGMLQDFLAMTRGQTDTVLRQADVIESHRWALLARQSADTGGLVRRR
ncbi:MAG: Gfo/Idh/MocA family oxidoreductase [Actinobacteria bacterium]|nr:Gfo/Idh/MocA family oxidoreductase [Actinomycetota bacterium]